MSALCSQHHCCSRPLHSTDYRCRSHGAHQSHLQQRHTHISHIELLQSSRTTPTSRSINQSINDVKFLGRRYTARPGAPTIVSGKYDQKVYSSRFLNVPVSVMSWRSEGCSRRLGHSRRNLVLQI